ncbi:hydrolase [Tumebacillus permanentifrigoris]|uniref:Hydroxymethylpyrimidine pyrophosphatase-like HAD family hydrolase n=1 Tax=Tumebacillus permanentifrigoris TaxID=378543 RepID=A0A316DB20_9BACL|nr:hydrolase [Tumebacillus permanentifrigoris]PWK13101.1 hypothetical protein C7459_108121 [Tumebacillus permanentifrigoris]
MIFASDLDQTLIYSARSMGTGHADSDIVPAELKDGKVLSYMAIAALALLREVADQLMFIPVTTRTIAQYQRIHLFQDEIRPKYAITSNGGNLLIDGVPDQQWAQEMHRKKEQTCAPSAEVLRLFHEIASPDWVIGERFCDELFFAIVIKREAMPLAAVLDLADRLSGMGWETSVQGRKVYLVPNVINKQAALVHIQEREGRTVLLASGDSLLDRCMLDLAHTALAPRHGELYREHQSRQNDSPYAFTEGSGILAAVEIVQQAVKLLAQREAGQR